MAVNKIEAIKTAKDGLDVFPDLLRYAQEGVEAIPADDLERLKWYGLFHRKTTPGYFMMRLRMPNGVLTSEQIAAIGEIANRCGRGQVDITTRQNIQLRWITIADAPWVLQRLAAAGLTSQQSGMDNIRNIVGCPLAGHHPGELLDTRPIAARLQQAIIGRREFSNLPRKFNISLTACPDDCTNAQAHDLSFQPATQVIDGRELVGFNVLVGGALGGQEPRLAEPIDTFVTPAQVVPFTLALLSTFRDEGPRESRKQARLKALIAEQSVDWLRGRVIERLDFVPARAGAAATVRTAGDHLGVGGQQEPGMQVVGCQIPAGRTTGDDLIAFGALAARYGASDLRLTVQQNILIPHVPETSVPDLLTEPLLERYTPEPSAFMRHLVACTGNDFCHFSLIDTKGVALDLARTLEERYEVDRDVRIHLSGCPHACGQHRIADVGLQGDRVRRDGEIVDAAHVFSGGRLGESPQLGAAIEDGVPLESLAAAVAREIEALHGAGSIRPRAAQAIAGS